MLGRVKGRVRKPGVAAAEIAAQVPAEKSEAEPTPVVAGQRPPEPAAASVVTQAPVGLDPVLFQWPRTFCGHTLSRK